MIPWNHRRPKETFQEAAQAAKDEKAHEAAVKAEFDKFWGECKECKGKTQATCTEATCKKCAKCVNDKTADADAKRIRAGSGESSHVALHRRP